MATYSEVMQHDDLDDRNYGGPSPPTTLSPSMSSSPMPFLRSHGLTFTPLSMASDFYHEVGDDARDNNYGGIPRPHSASSQARTHVQSLASARATMVTKRSNNNIEYDLLSPVDSESVSSSPKLGHTSPAHGLERYFPTAHEETFYENTSPKARATNHEAEADRGRTHQQSHDRSCTSVKGGRESALRQNGCDERDPNPRDSTCTIIRPKPRLRTASTKGVNIVHTSPDVLTRTSSYRSKIAQLEATAEKLSMTSSIEDAIRDLHDEQKRSDSRRSSILAASIGSGSGPDSAGPVPFSRQFSAASSILETKNAARFGGYSPAGYVMSPNNSLLSNHSRLRSGSSTRLVMESDPVLSRNGPGRVSIKSTKSATKSVLGDIAEMEPSNLTLAAMDEADRLDEEPEEDNGLPIPQMQDIDLTSNAQYASNAHDYWEQAVVDARREEISHERPSTTNGSIGTYEQAERAFADFDGAHCLPEADKVDSEPRFELDLSTEIPLGLDANRPRISKPFGLTVRPKSYMDPESGQQMMYYPARVPMMLNLPQKLSKKPKAAAKNKRVSQDLSAMPDANRQSVNWLPEVLPEPPIDPLGSPESKSYLSTPVHRPLSIVENAHSTIVDNEVQREARPNPRPINEEARKSRLSVTGMSVTDPSDKRKSKPVLLQGLPPQLRASAFFDLPSESPQIELKNGSAIDTLDSILDASAKAPVSAFTDHVFAGKLGAEVYGNNDRKRKSHIKHNSTAEVLEVKKPEVKKRNSFFNLRTFSKLSSHTFKDDKHSTIHGGVVADNSDEESSNERQRLAGSTDGNHVAEEDAEEYDSEDDPAYTGPPTTLLAELQIRKRQQKLRTRPLGDAYPNGMHSTLLEMDTIAEFERRNRRGKKVNLAWEDPNSAIMYESDDEDTPLGLLMAARAGATQISIQMDKNRPLDLMERREREDSEPLSQRRDRLQGNHNRLMPQRSMISLRSRGALGMSGGLAPSSPYLQSPTPESEEIEGETLAERMRRLRARDEGDNSLPRARPVSTAFSAELFSQLGDAFKDEISSNDKSKEKAQPREEEETLGQRRRRLQDEREARDMEMNFPASLNPSPIKPVLAKRHSMADVLGAFAGQKRVLSDPRADAERAKEEEAARFRRQQEKKLATLRSQMPTHSSTPNLARSGGYINDGTAGGLGQPGAIVAPTPYAGQNPVLGNAMVNMQCGGLNAGIYNNVYSTGAVQGGMTHGYAMPNGYGAYGIPELTPQGYGMPTQLQMPLQMQQPGQQYDRVDRWRQSIAP